MGKLGETLRERRIQMGLSLEQVESETRIRSRLLAALEDGDYDRLPNPGYVRGYISSYARFLELDPHPLLNMYKAETGAGRTHLVNLPQAEEAVKPTGQQHAVPWRIGVMIAVIVALVSLFVWIGVRMASGPKQTVAPLPSAVTEASQTTTPTSKETTKETTKEPPAKQLETVPETKEPAASEQTEKAGKQPFTVRVRVASDSASWVRITVDGKRAYEGVLTGGQSKRYDASESAKVLLGKPESVTVTRDGKPVEIKDTGNLGTVTLKANSGQ